MPILATHRNYRELFLLLPGIFLQIIDFFRQLTRDFEVQYKYRKENSGQSGIIVYYIFDEIFKVVQEQVRVIAYSKKTQEAENDRFFIK